MSILILSQAVLMLTLSGEPTSVDVVIETDAAAKETDLASLRAAAVPNASERPSTRMEQARLVVALRVQNAIRMAREASGKGDYAAAIAHLEPCVATAGGSTEYLVALESAYRSYIGQLLKEGRSREASMIAERLRAMGGSTELAANAEAKTIPTATAAEPPKDSQEPEQATGIAAIGKSMVKSVQSLVPASAKETDGKDTDKPRDIEVRAKLDEASLTSQPSTDLDRAKLLFQEKRYPEALIAYEKAYDSDPVSVQPQRSRWGYCLLFVTVEKYNELIERDPETVDLVVWEELQADVETAKRLAPKIEYCNTVCSAINDRISQATVIARTETPRNVATSQPGMNTQAYTGLSGAKDPAVQFRHLGAQNGSWQVTETDNFVIYHRDAKLAETIAARSEQARREAHDLWFGGEALTPWQPKCELYLYPTAQEYSQATSVGPQSPGHSKVVNNGGTIQSRRVFLRVDDPNMPHAVLPHEIAHVVFAGKFGAHTLPRWADEGMAVLTEPVDKQDAHLANLARTFVMGRGFSCGEILTMQEYPAGERMRDFYAHSVGVCRLLVEKHGHDKLVQFLRRSLDTGNYEMALREIYGMSSFSELEGNFRQFAGGLSGSGQVALGR